MKATFWLLMSRTSRHHSVSKRPDGGLWNFMVSPCQDMRSKRLKTGLLWKTSGSSAWLRSQTVVRYSTAITQMQWPMIALCIPFGAMARWRNWSWRSRNYPRPRMAHLKLHDRRARTFPRQYAYCVSDDGDRIT